MKFLRWPIPAFLTWGAAWLAFRTLISADVSGPIAFTVACVLGASCAVFGSTLPRKLAIATGFPLSLLLSGTAALPAWAWLLPALLIILVYPISAWRDAPVFPTPARALVELPQHINLPAGAKILDAGCGLGDGLKALRATFPESQLFGIEWSWPLRVVAALRCPWAKIRQGDIWRADWSEYSVVYLFQRPESMPRAAEKATREMKPGTWVVSLEFPARELQATASVRAADGRPVWIYQLPFRRATKR